MKKVIAFVLVCLMLLSAVGCSDPTGGPSDSTTDGGDVNTSETGTIVTTESIYDENGYQKDSIPDTLKYGGKTFNILVSDNQYRFSFAEKEDETAFGAILYERQRKVEDRLGVEMNLIRKPGNYSTSAEFCNEVYVAKYGNEGTTYDLVAAYNLTPPVLAHMGLSLEMCDDGSYIDFENPWWGKEAYESIAINDKVFFMTDNSSWNSIKNMMAVYINHELAKQYGVDINEIYDLVAENKWTMSRMFKMCENIYEDTDMDGKKSGGDTFGLSTGSAPWNEGWYYAAGLLSTKINDDLTFSLTLGDTETIDFLDWFNAQYHDKNYILPVDTKQYGAFLGERAMFYYSACAVTVQDILFDTSAVPAPMYKEDQGRYYTHFSNTYDMWCIPVTTSDYACSTAVLECLASEAYRIIAPECYDVHLKVKKSTNERAAAMYDVIRDSMVFDFGYVYGLCFSNENTVLHVRRYINNNQTDWVSKWKSVEDTYKSEVETILNRLK